MFLVVLVVSDFNLISRYLHARMNGNLLFYADAF